MNRIALGTAQLGLEYGVTNRSGMPTLKEATRIVREAEERGVATIDTASAYGESEARLGQIGLENFEVVTKISSRQNGTYQPGLLTSSIEASLKRLRIDTLHGALLHNADELQGEFGNAVYQELHSAQSRGLAKLVGISIYRPEQYFAVQEECPIGILQAPFNAFDRSVYESGLLAKVKLAGVEFHARSVFLQGVLLDKAFSTSGYFQRWAETINRWFDYTENVAGGPLASALSIPLAEEMVDRVVVGVETAYQLRQILDLIDIGFAPVNIKFTDLDPKLINPTMWKLN